MSHVNLNSLDRSQGQLICIMIIISNICTILPMLFLSGPVSHIKLKTNQIKVILQTSQIKDIIIMHIVCLRIAYRIGEISTSPIHFYNKICNVTKCTSGVKGPMAVGRRGEGIRAAGMHPEGSGITRHHPSPCLPLPDCLPACLPAWPSALLPCLPPSVHQFPSVALLSCLSL